MSSKAKLITVYVCSMITLAFAKNSAKHMASEYQDLIDNKRYLYREVRIANNFYSIYGFSLTELGNMCFVHKSATQQTIDGATR